MVDESGRGFRVRPPALLGRLWRRSESRAETEAVLPTYRKAVLSTPTKWLLFVGLAAVCLVNGYLFAAVAPQLVMPFTVAPVLLLALLIWALPAGDYAPVRTMRGLYWTFFAALILWPNYLAIALPGLPWVTLVRLTGGPLVCVLLASISVSEKFRRDLYATLRESSPIWICLLIYMAIMTASLPLSKEIGITIDRYIVAQLNFTGIFFISCYIFRKKGSVEFWVAFFIFMDIILCLIGLWENRLGRVPWAGHIPSFVRIQDDSVKKILAGGARAANGIYRVQSVATTPLGFAEILGLTMPFILHVAVSKYHVFLRAVAFLCYPLFFYLMLLMDARLGFVAMLVTGAVYLLLSAVVRWREVRGSLFGPAVVIAYPAIFTALVASTFLIGRVKTRVWGGGAQAASTEARKGQWRSAIPKISSHPFGHGYGTAADVLHYANPAGVISIDSYYLNLMLDTGILGLITYLALFLGAAGFGVAEVVVAPPDRELRMLVPLSVGLIVFIVIKGVLSQEANHPIVFMMLGAIVALIWRSKQARRAIAEGSS